MTPTIQGIPKETIISTTPHMQDQLDDMDRAPKAHGEVLSLEGHGWNSVDFTVEAWK